LISVEADVGVDVGYRGSREAAKGNLYMLVVEETEVQDVESKKENPGLPLS
jgi:hypothetical protein